MKLQDKIYDIFYSKMDVLKISNNVDNFHSTMWNDLYKFLFNTTYNKIIEVNNKKYIQMSYQYPPVHGKTYSLLVPLKNKLDKTYIHPDTLLQDHCRNLPQFIDPRNGNYIKALYIDEMPIIHNECSSDSDVNEILNEIHSDDSISDNEDILIDCNSNNSEDDDIGELSDDSSDTVISVE